MGHQCDITDKFEKLSISPGEKRGDDAHSMLLLFKPNLIKYFIGNTLRIYEIKLHQRILLLVYLRKI